MKPEQLLSVAETLFIEGTTSKRPRQAYLRRSISTAYYALFHALIQRATLELFGKTPSGNTVRRIASRTFDHKAIKNSCEEFQKPFGGMKEKYREIASNPNPIEIIVISSIFVRLHDKRIKADYNLFSKITKKEASEALSDATKVMGLLDTALEQHYHATHTFLAALLFHSQSRLLDKR